MKERSEEDEHLVKKTQGKKIKYRQGNENSCSFKTKEIFVFVSNECIWSEVKRYKKLRKFFVKGEFRSIQHHLQA